MSRLEPQVSEALEFKAVREQVSKRVPNSAISELLSKVKHNLKKAATPRRKRRQRIYPGVQAGVPFAPFHPFRPLNEAEMAMFLRGDVQESLPPTARGLHNQIRISYCINDPFTTCVVVDMRGRVRLAGVAKRSVQDKPAAGATIKAFKRALEQGWITMPRGGLV